jgi:hypothetical protein
VARALQLRCRPKPPHSDHPVQPHTQTIYERYLHLLPRHHSNQQNRIYYVDAAALFAIDLSKDQKPSRRCQFFQTLRLRESCKQASNFPRDLVHKSTPHHHLDAYFARLEEQAPRLFCKDGNAALNIWEYDDNIKRWPHTPLPGNWRLKDGQILSLRVHQKFLSS